MEYAILFVALAVVPAAIWLGAWITRDRGGHYKGRPPSTEGGEPTIYRRREPTESNA
jgi:hypothetical protein